MKTGIQRYSAGWVDQNVFLGMVGITLGVLGIGFLLFDIFPLPPINLFFFTGLLFLLALYRPNWCFLLLVAALPFETLNMLPESVGVILRPYQWLCIILVLALGIRIVSHRTAWPLFSFSWLDIFLALIPLGALVSGLFSGGEGPRLAVIVASFYGLYVLARVFLRTVGDVQVASRMLFASGYISIIFGIIQNAAFERGRLLAVVMPGRPNGTFTEPDWFGFFSAALLFFVFSQVDRRLNTVPDGTSRWFWRIFPVFLGLIPILVVLILTVSRSAWLAALAALVLWILTALLVEGKVALRRSLQSVQLFVIAAVLALLIVVDVPLTRFDLLNRAESTATGLQEITIACDTPTDVPAVIETIEVLSAFGCRHITLEDRAALAAAGQSIQTVQRPDPNIVIRSEIYRKTWAEIRQHPILGIGWGNIGTVLGRDNTDNAYNASNLWFEIILGAGLLGLIGLAGAVAIIISGVVRRLSSQGQAETGIILVCALLLLFLVFNSFNAGLLIGVVWFGLATIPVLLFPKLSVKPV